MSKYALYVIDDSGRYLELLCVADSIKNLQRDIKNLHYPKMLSS